jgi:mannitol-1-/sugar-/sorbitol-6-/2-deoxyglucose-6-phosphatase
MIKAAIFDMDGLLIDSEPLWRKAQIAAFQTVGFTPTKEEFNHHMGRRVNEVVESYYHMYPWKGPSVEDIEALIVEKLLELVRSEGTMRPGVHHVLQVCKDAELDMAIASSSNSRIINTVVDALDLRSHFSHLYSAEHEAYGKPHPGVFITAAGLLGIHPHHCIVFEDAPSGVLAAKAAKMICVAVPESDVKAHPFIQTADVVLDSLAEFTPEQLKSL